MKRREFLTVTGGSLLISSVGYAGIDSDMPTNDGILHITNMEASLK